MKPQYALQNFSIEEEQIKNEMERQENHQVTLLFAMKWFYSELSNKGAKSSLVGGLMR